MRSNFGRAHGGDVTLVRSESGWTEFAVTLPKNTDYDSTVAKVQAVVDGYAGLQRDLLTYLRERIKEVLTGQSASIVVRIFGPELPTLRAKAAEVAAAFKDVSGVTTLKVEQQALVPRSSSSRGRKPPRFTDSPKRRFSALWPRS